MTQKKLQNLKEAATGSEIQEKTKHSIKEKNQQGKSLCRWWQGYNPGIPQGFEESLEDTREKKEVPYSWPKVWKMDA